MRAWPEFVASWVPKIRSPQKHAQSSYNICKLRLKELSKKRQRYTAEDQLYILSHIVFTPVVRAIS